jgi:hypothetical protein
MLIVIGVILLALSAGMLVIARPKAGQDCAIWLSKPWILGQAYVMAVLIIAVVGVSLVLNSLPG